MIPEPRDHMMIEEHARMLATTLHARHCHSEDGEGCTWNYESWVEGDQGDMCNTVRHKYLTKAHKILRYFDNMDEINKVLKFLSDINPKLALQLVKEL